MEDPIYQKLRQQLDQYAVGFPVSESGNELKILKMLFTSEEAELFLFLGHQAGDGRRRCRSQRPRFRFHKRFLE
jgi:hypothetical protein